MISAEHLRFAYTRGEFSLRIPSFEVATGERVAVVGPSGSGKTTLLNLLAGIYPVDAGHLNVAAAALHTLSDRGRRDFRITHIGFVFQSFELLDYLTVFDNIVHPYRITSTLTLDRDVRQRARVLAEQMGIERYLGRRPHELSSGEQQRAAICRALLAKPRLILADEATGNLDPKNKGRILDLLFAAVRDHDATLVAVTHDHELLSRFDRVIDFAEFRSD